MFAYRQGTSFVTVEGLNAYPRLACCTIADQTDVIQSPCRATVSLPIWASSGEFENLSITSRCATSNPTTADNRGSGALAISMLCGTKGSAVTSRTAASMAWRYIVQIARARSGDVCESQAIFMVLRIRQSTPLRLSLSASGHPVQPSTPRQLQMRRTMRHCFSG